MRLVYRMAERHSTWEDAPYWALSLGICKIKDSAYYGKKCWCSIEGPKDFSELEVRPLENNYKQKKDRSI